MDSPASDAKDDSSRGGRRTRPASRAKAAPQTTPPSSAPASPTGPASSGRTRRGRRGGAGRKKKPAETMPAAQAPAAPEAAPPRVPSRAKPSVSDGALDGQAAALTQLMELQLETLKSVQGSLSAIENRLAGGGGGYSAERPRLGIFVDVPNVMYAAERQKVKIDYAKLLAFLTRGRELVRAAAYAPISDESGERFEAQRFVQPFANLGYRLVTKPHKRYADGSMKANFDVELAIDVVVMSDRLDVVSLVSGDGDFRRLVELVASKGVRVEVIAFSQSTAQELRAVADQYIDLNDYLAELKV